MSAIDRTPAPMSLPDREIISSDTVVFGAGVIGLSTAYYLALAVQNTAKAKIVVVEPSAHIAPAASGQATGGLGNFGFGPETAELGSLSYALFQDLAGKAGREQFGFSDLSVYRTIPEDFAGTPNPPDSWGPAPPVEKPVSALPDWIQARGDWKVKQIAGFPHAAHLYVHQVV